MNFSNFSLQEMLVLNKELCAAIRAKQTAESANKITGFAPGNKVSYQDTKKRITGEVVKVLRTNVDVLCDGRIWRIPAARLNHV